MEPQRGFCLRILISIIFGFPGFISHQVLRLQHRRLQDLHHRDHHAAGFYF